MMVESPLYGFQRNEIMLILSLDVREHGGCQAMSSLAFDEEGPAAANIDCVY